MGTRRLVAVALSFVVSVAVSAPAHAASSLAPYRDFEKVCLLIFSKRSTDSGNSAGQQICKCTSQESKHQGVTVPELEKETAAMRKDPKYKIQNPKLLASFHYCVILAMDQKAHEEQDTEQNAQ